MKKQLCVVQIDLNTFILPMADGLKLVDIMAKAAWAERNYRRDEKRFTLRDTKVDVGLELVRPEDIEPPRTIPAGLALPAPISGDAA